MKNIVKYVKPFLGGVLLAFLLLFIQAMCDLSLPTYMSDIVNVGIQQGGVEHAAPEAISVQGMRLMRLFMTEEERALADSQYALTPATQTDARGKTYASQYANLPEGELYVRKVLDSEEAQARLDAAFSSAGGALLAMTRGQGEQQAAQPERQQAQIPMALIYARLPELEAMPAEALANLRAAADQLPEMMRGQVGTAITKGVLTEMGADMAGVQRGYILRIGGLMLLLALAGGVATVLVGLISARTSAGVGRMLRKRVFARVESFSSAEMDRFSTASLITRTTNDITQVQVFVQMGIRMLCYAPIMCIGGVIMATRRAPSMTWILALAGALLLCLVAVIMSVAMPKFRIIQKLVDKLNLVTRESLSGLLVIRAFGAAEHEKARFDAANRDLMDTSLFVNRVMATMMPIMGLLMNGVSLLVTWTGAHQIAASSLQIGDMMAFTQYAIQVIMSFLFVTMILVFLPRAVVSAARIEEVLSTEPTIVDPAQPKQFSSEDKGLVVFDHVNFRFPGAEEDALHDITFTAKPGETTAIIGSTGSGKSTIANLLLRFYDVTGGSIRVDGLDVREVAQHDLRARIGFVPQKGVLLSGTIASNLRYGDKEASDAALAQAAAVAQATEFIDEKEGRFDAEIAQGGTNVSGGQKQRLSIARALVKRPEIYVFDDSFSALDYKTDVTLRRALRETTGGSTMMIVASRVGTILHAEQIIVLEKGHIVGIGTHAELLQSCPEYAEIASSQLSKEELA